MHSRSRRLRPFAAPERPDLAGVVLAGGRSSRMGRDKALLPIGGPEAPTLLANRARLLTRIGVRDVLVSRRRDHTTPRGDWRVVHDALEDEGPLAGIVSGMESFPDRQLVVLAVDMADVDLALLATLLAHADPYTGAAPRVGARWEPLCAVYPPQALGLARRVLSGPTASPSRLLDLLAAERRVRPVALPEPLARRMRSWNRPEDVRTSPAGAPNLAASAARTNERRG